jgi:transcriptional regulator with XRE-family HTH domain
MSRTEHLRRSLAWSQPQMGEYLGVHQSNVSRLEGGELDERGPVCRLLDALAAALAKGVVTPGMSPARCLFVLDMAPLVDADSPSPPGDA